MKTFKGHIYYYRIFDFTNEIDLALATELMSREGEIRRFRLRKTSNAMVIEEAPLVINLGTWSQEVGDKSYPVVGIGKIWGFGAISINLRFEIASDTPWEDILTLNQKLETDPSIHNQCVDLTKKLMVNLKGSLKSGLVIWDQYEDYIITIQDAEGVTSESVRSLKESKELYQLILGETKIEISEQMKEVMRRHTYHYAQNDIVVLDWNSAYICSQGDSKDIADVLEFALCQLLEMRFYDDILDKKLNTLYKGISTSAPGVFSQEYSKLAKDASLIYIELSEIVEKIENSLKVIGDFYYAKIFRAALERFRFSDWQSSVDQKLKNLADLSMLFHSEVNVKRTQWMEMTIIILITVEVIPLVYKVFQSIDWSFFLNK